MTAKPVTDPTPIDRLSARAGATRAPGPRAMRTRVALLDTTASLLREVPFHQLTSAHVTQRAGLSPAAFYRYFADLGDAIAELTARMGDSVHAIAELVRDADWTPDARVRECASRDRGDGAVLVGAPPAVSGHRSPR